MTRLRYAALDWALGVGLLGDRALATGARCSIVRRLRQEEVGGVEAQDERLATLVDHMSHGPIAEHPTAANEQHYELPAEFFEVFLGPRRKYSCCLWAEGVDSLAAAEEAMLDLTCRRAGVRDGMTLLDLGCGWGALTLWLAERYDVQVVGVSNSVRQRRWIEAERDRRGLSARVEVVTADVNDFDPGRRFDRVLSVEMFEHLHNWRVLLARVAGWLAEDGRLFVHVFSHRRLAYRFAGTWASERFFTAGTMPSDDLLLRFADDLVVTHRWAVGGGHYARTLTAWRDQLGSQRDEALRALAAVMPRREARNRLAAWRLFLLASAAMWSWRGGDEWMVSHYLLAPRTSGPIGQRHEVPYGPGDDT